MTASCCFDFCFCLGYLSMWVWSVNHMFILGNLTGRI